MRCWQTAEDLPRNFLPFHIIDAHHLRRVTAPSQGEVFRLPLFKYPKNLVRRTVGKTRYRSGMRDVDLFATPPNPTEIAREQVDRFNRTWAHALSLPFYQKVAAEHKLPTVISQLDELDQWPVLTKKDFRQDEDLMWAGMDRALAYETSGTTSDPIRFPMGRHDGDAIYASMWSYRGALGLQPFDSFGAFDDFHPGTVAGKAQLSRNFLSRRARDVLGNSWMFNSFETDPTRLDAQLSRIARMRPDYLVGRTNSMKVLARRAEETGILRNAGYAPRATIITSELITPDCVQVVATGLNTTVSSEYGTREIGVIAASTSEGTWPMRTVWNHSLLRVGAESCALVTTIGDRAFPLINYRIGDVIDPVSTGPGGTVLELGPVKGRLADIIHLPTRTGVTQPLEAVGISLAVVQLPEVHGVQLVQQEGAVTILVVAPGIDRSEYLRNASTSLKAAYPDLDEGTVKLALIDDMIPGARGKRALMVPEEKIDLDRLETTVLN